MGPLCSCLSLEGLEEFVHSDNSMHRHCSCFRGLVRHLIRVYTTFLPREEVQTIPLASQGTSSSDASTSVTENPISDTFRSPPRPSSYDAPRCSQMQSDRLASKHDKSHEESEPLRGSNSGTNIEMSTVQKCSGSNYEIVSKSLLKNTSKGVPSGVTYSFTSYEDEDEDVCPTCLEEYTYENPRIVTKCSHHFHLSCIYEWQERSELCPVCSKVMVFDEA